MRLPGVAGGALVRAVAIGGSVVLLALDGRPGALFWLVLVTTWGVAVTAAWRWPSLIQLGPEALVCAFGASAAAWGLLVGLGVLGDDASRGWQLAIVGVSALVLGGAHAGALVLWPGLARHRIELLVALLGLAVGGWGLALVLTAEPDDQAGGWVRVGVGATAVGLIAWYRIARWLLAHMDWIDRPRARQPGPADPDPRGVHRWPD